MSHLRPSAIPAFLSRLSARLPSSSPPAHFLLPLVAATTLGHGAAWLKPCLSLALSDLPPTPTPLPPEPAFPLDDLHQHPRRFAVAQIKEALVKSAVLVGVPKVIETLLELQDAVDEADRTRLFVRRDLEGEGQTIAGRQASGRAGLNSVYQGQLEPIFERMHRDGLDDLRYLSETVTYGTFLTPYNRPPPTALSAATAPSSAPQPNLDPLAHDPKLLSIVTLSALVPQRTEREILWHLRGAIRQGWTRAEVESLQSAVEDVCAACGVLEVGKGMPRVAEVDVLPEDKDRQE
ncbi:hypothetical protein JCM8097_000865 [Rhodosporidiobolus ruineniae]